MSAKLTLDRFELIWYLQGAMSGSHLRWSIYEDFVNIIYPQLNDDERNSFTTSPSVTAPGILRASLLTSPLMRISNRCLPASTPTTDISWNTNTKARKEARTPISGIMNTTLTRAN